MSIPTKKVQKKSKLDQFFFRKPEKSKNSLNKQNSSAQDILTLHQTIGNQAVQKLFESATIQASLKISQPNDKYEQEADRVADQVMRMSDPKLQRQPENEAEEETLQTKPLAGQITPLIQRQAEPEEEEEEPVQPGYDQELEESNPIMESVPTRDAGELGEEEEELIQTKSDIGAASQATSGIAHAIHFIKGGGQPLPASERSFFEPRFGRDFGNVRVYSDSRAALTAQSINARAFTLGRDIVFGAEQYSPGSRKGRSLLAHELTHIVQQGGNRTSSKAQHRESIESDPIDKRLVGFEFQTGNKVTRNAKKRTKGGSLSDRMTLTHAPLQIQRAALGKTIIANAEKRWRNPLLKIFYNNFFGAIVPNDKWPHAIARDSFLWVAGEMKKPKVRRAYYRAVRRDKRSKRRLTKNEKWFQRLWDRYRLVSHYDKQLRHFPSSDYYIDYGSNKCNLFVFDAIWDAGKKFVLANGHYPGPDQVSRGVTGLKRITKYSQVKKGDIFWEENHVGLVRRRIRRNRYMFRSIEWYNPVRSVNLLYSKYSFFRVK